MILIKSIKRLRLIAFFLFLIPTLALVFSLVAHNYLVTYQFQLDPFSKYLKDTPGNKYQIDCNKSNDYCVKKLSFYLNYPITENGKTIPFNECFIHRVKHDIFFENNEYEITEIYDENNEIFEVKNQFKNKNFIMQIEVYNSKSATCIKNYKFLYNLYSYIPSFFEFTAKLRNDGMKLASGEAINPFVYGETSISNMVKRFPLNYIFKPLVFIGVVLMLFYWIYYNNIFNNITKKKINSFFIFGILSAVFLFLHIYFLGSDNKSELFKDIRRLIIFLFIFFELLAQIFLAKNIYSNKTLLSDYCIMNIIYLKVAYVSVVFLITISILVILSFSNLPSKIDNILEWNYFLFLLIFYLLSFLMWKKE